MCFGCAFSQVVSRIVVGELMDGEKKEGGM